MGRRRTRFAYAGGRIIRPAKSVANRPTQTHNQTHHQTFDSTRSVRRPSALRPVTHSNAGETASMNRSKLLSRLFCLFAIAAMATAMLFDSPAEAREAVAEPPADQTDASEATDEADKAGDPYLRVPESVAATESEMRPYVQTLRDSPITFEMVPIPGGTYTIGSSEEERMRFAKEYAFDPDDADEVQAMMDEMAGEAPQVELQIAPFWMATTETTWDLYDTYRTNLDIQRRNLTGRAPDGVDAIADAVSRPTAAYTDMTFNMGHDGYPAICMTQLAAKSFCQWLSKKTGQYYRLPTEAEWEYACRAGTTTAYSWGDDLDEIDDYAWYFDNADDQYQKVGEKKPNPWGLHDMHGNVAEWCLDGYKADAYEIFASQPKDAFHVIKPFSLYPRSTRGGSWNDDPYMLRSASRIPSDPTWKIQDPQLPQSMWYHTDALFVGFRIVRPLEEPTAEQIQEYTLYPDVPQELVK